MGVRRVVGESVHQYVYLVGQGCQLSRQVCVCARQASLSCLRIWYQALFTSGDKGKVGARAPPLFSWD